MNTVDAHRMLFSIDFEFDFALNAKRLIMLRHLMRLRQIRVEIIFPVEFAKRGDLTPECKAGPDRVFDRFFIQNWQCTRKPHAYWAYIRVLLLSEARTAPAPNFCVGKELCMNF